jgi:nucleotide-binding universal stress UspA family protein
MDASAHPLEIRRVLVPVDFGDASAAAVAAAGALAHHCGAELRLLHAEPIDAPAYFTHEQVQAMAAQRQRVRAQAESFLARFGRQHTSHSFTTALEEQPPPEAILQHEAWADLIVMGTHGRHGPRRWWLGSVAERVLRETTKPLLIVRATDRADNLFSRVAVQAAPPLAGAAARQCADALAASLGSTVVDRRREAGAGAAESRPPTLLAVAAPPVRHGAWLSGVGEPLIRHGAVPVLFVPETDVAGGTGS